jgi:hypothetical protein
MRQPAWLHNQRAWCSDHLQLANLHPTWPSNTKEYSCSSPFGVFFAIRLSGDPVALMLADYATEQQKEQLRHSLGLDQPLPVQFGIYLGYDNDCCVLGPFVTCGSVNRPQRPRWRADDLS